MCKLIDFLFRLIFCITVTFLKLAAHLVALTSNNIKVVIGQLAPLLFDLTFELFPFSGDLIPIHDIPPTMNSEQNVGRYAACNSGIKSCPGDRQITTGVLRSQPSHNLVLTATGLL